MAFALLRSGGGLVRPGLDVFLQRIGSRSGHVYARHTLASELRA